MEDLSYSEKTKAYIAANLELEKGLTRLVEYLEIDTDVYQNTWILWSGSMEEPVVVDKPCSQVDILPTLSDLLGLEYDSRMMAGTDVLSTADPIVIFFSNSWLTEKEMYSRYTETFVPADGVNMSEEEMNVYVENIKYIVNSRLKLGQLILLLSKGYPKEFCAEIAYKNMNTDYTATRMLGYLYRVTNPRIEDLVDEMLAILSDRDAIIQKKEMEQAQAVLNDIYNNGL